MVFIAANADSLGELEMSLKEVRHDVECFAGFRKIDIVKEGVS